MGVGGGGSEVSSSIHDVGTLRPRRANSEGGRGVPAPVHCGLGAGPLYTVSPQARVYSTPAGGRQPPDGQPECVLRGRPLRGQPAGGGLLGEAGARLGSVGPPVLCSDPWGCPTLRLRGVGSERGPSRQVAGRPDSRCRGSEARGGRRGGAHGVGVLGAAMSSLQFNCWFGEGTGLLRPLTRASVSGPGAAFLPGPGSAARCPVLAPPPGSSTVCDSGPTKPRPPAPGHTGSQVGQPGVGGAPSQAARSPPAPSPATCVPGLQRDLTASGRGGHLGGGGLGGCPPELSSAPPPLSLPRVLHLKGLRLWGLQTSHLASAPLPHPPSP